MTLVRVLKEADIVKGRKYLIVHRECGHAFVGTSTRGNGDGFNGLHPLGWVRLCAICAIGEGWSGRWKKQLYFEIQAS
jgi:hypothetical protein